MVRATAGFVAANSSVAKRAEAYIYRQAARRAGTEWLGGVGNVFALAALAVCVGMNIALLDGTARGVVPTAPLLLLLHPHVPPLTTLHSGNRYAPVGTAIALVLGGAATGEVASRAIAAGILGIDAIRGAVLLLCAFPSLLLCCRFLWSGRPSPPMLVYSALPLNTVPLFLSHARPLYDLGGAGLLAGALDVWLARRVRHAGNKFV